MSATASKPMKHPDEALPTVQLSLQQFVSLSQSLFPSEPEPQAGPELDRFIRLALAGRIQGVDGNSLSRVLLNVQQGASAPPIGKYQVKRDIDSVIGITCDLPFRRTLAIYPLACFRDTLTKDNHMKYNLVECKVCTLCITIRRLKGLSSSGYKRCPAPQDS
jgi:hypothetical protein